MLMSSSSSCRLPHTPPDWEILQKDEQAASYDLNKNSWPRQKPATKGSTGETSGKLNFIARKAAQAPTTASLEMLLVSCTR